MEEAYRIRASSVYVATVVPAERLRCRDSIPGKVKRFFFISQTSLPALGAHPASCTLGSGSKADGQLSAEFKNGVSEHPLTLPSSGHNACLISQAQGQLTLSCR